MKERSLTNISASVHQRLLNLARAENRPFNELLQLFAIERFLFRFSRSPHAGRFVLKGAQMLRVWEAPLERPTMDIDMLGRIENTVDTLVHVVRDCIKVEVEPDGVEFDPESVSGEQIVKAAEYQGMRIRVRGTLGKIRLHVQIDFGFGDKVVPAPVWVELPELLDLGSPRLLGYTPESTIAEKFQAMVALDMANTRIKDFYDIWALARAREFNGAILVAAIKATFERRGTSLPLESPTALTEWFGADTEKQALWTAFLRKGRLDASGVTLEVVVGELRDFLMPPSVAAARDESFEMEWKSTKGWTAKR